MKQVFYRLPDSREPVRAFCLWEEKRTSLLFVQSIGKTRGPTIVIAERRAEDSIFEDSTANTFPIEDWSAAMISVLLMLLVKENAINQLTTPHENGC